MAQKQRQIGEINQSSLMDYHEGKVDDMLLALLWLTIFDEKQFGQIELFRRVKAEAALRGMRLREYIAQALEETCGTSG
jgi:hypothetical protein